jgi:Uri superfamily endonuclease
VQADRVGKNLSSRRTVGEDRGGFTHCHGKGVYTLIIAVLDPLDLKIGCLGIWHFPKGLYLYTGSALGPGGLSGRIGRHVGHRNSRFWHIDYLLGSRGVRVELAIWAHTPERMECRINTLLHRRFESQAKGFGSSDCVKSCPSHLLRSEGLSKAQLGDVVFKVYKRSGLRPTLC